MNVFGLSWILRLIVSNALQCTSLGVEILFSKFDLFWLLLFLQLPAPELHPMVVAFNASTVEKYVLLVIKKVRSR